MPNKQILPTTMDIQLAHRCSICDCYLDEEDLFCANCGTENPHITSPKTPQPSTTQRSFDCDSCGASMTYDAAAGSLRCPYCGNEALREQAGSRFVQPWQVIPFSIDLPAAEKIFRKWLGASFWRPGDLTRAARLGKAARVHVPFWSFSAATHTQWTADSSPAPAGSRGDWQPVSGNNHSRYSEILVGGSRVLSHSEAESLLPFEISKGLAPEASRKPGTVFEQFQVPRKVARPRARAALESLEQQACQQLVPGRSRNVHVNVRIESMTGQPISLPVWILAYRYKSNVHRVLINGQTGKIVGSAPFATGKLITLIVILIGLAFLAIGIMAAANM